jgi:hypothetical protein
MDALILQSMEGPNIFFLPSFVQVGTIDNKSVINSVASEATMNTLISLIEKPSTFLRSNQDVNRIFC